MKGTILVNRINKSGNYNSALDYDPSFSCAENPVGFFKMVIQPIENSDGQSEIRYMKTDLGIKVSGEAYIISGSDETEIDKKCRRYHRRYDNLIQREVFSSENLW